MKNDEQAIRELVKTWFDATKTGDTETVLSLMTDDVVFEVVGQEPFGKEKFKIQSEQMKGMKLDGANDIKEIEIVGDFAYIRGFIDMMVTPAGGGDPVRRSGYTLSIFRKGLDGKWLLARDANLLQ